MDAAVDKVMAPHLYVHLEHAAARMVTAASHLLIATKVVTGNLESVTEPIHTIDHSFCNISF